MRAIRKYSGLVLGYILWLPIYCIIRFTTRTRVLVVCDGEVLLLKSWLYAGYWGCPGGGIKRGETPIQTILRELGEETGIIAKEKELKSLGLMEQAGSRAHAFHGFILELDTKPQVKIQTSAIVDSKWFKPADIKNLPTDNHVQTLLAAWREQR